MRNLVHIVLLAFILGADAIARAENPRLQSNKKTLAPGLESPDERPPLFKFVIRASEATEPQQPIYGLESLTHRGISLSVAVAEAYEMKPYRVFPAPDLPKGRFDVFIILPEGRGDQLTKFYRDALAATFDIEVRKEQKEMDVFVLSLTQGQARGVLPSPGGRESVRLKPRSLGLVNGKFSNFVRQLEAFLDRPLIDEAGLKGRYDAEIHWDRDDQGAIIQAVRDQLGLNLTEARRSSTALIVEKTKEEQ